MDFPEPETPVIATSNPIGMLRSRFFKLCARAPKIWISLDPGLRRAVGN